MKINVPGSSCFLIANERINSAATIHIDHLSVYKTGAESIPLESRRASELSQKHSADRVVPIHLQIV